MCLFGVAKKRLVKGRGRKITQHYSVLILATYTKAAR